MKLTLVGHEDLYAVEQLCITLFGVGAEGSATSQLHRGKVWLTAVTTIEQAGKTAKGVRRPLIDVLVDGEFIEEKKIIDLRFRGSENQRIIDVKKSLAEDDVILWEDGSG